MARPWMSVLPLLQVVADYTRLSAVQPQVVQVMVERQGRNILDWASA
jgi:hypothetical protein